MRCLWSGEQDAITNAAGYAKFRSRLHRALIRVYDEAGNAIETRATSTAAAADDAVIGMEI